MPGGIIKSFLYLTFFGLECVPLAVLLGTNFKQNAIAFTTLHRMEGEKSVLDASVLPSGRGSCVLFADEDQCKLPFSIKKRIKVGIGKAAVFFFGSSRPSFQTSFSQ